MNKGLPLEARAAVLVVDDELVRILTVQALEEAGFRVEEAVTRMRRYRGWTATQL